MTRAEALTETRLRSRDGTEIVYWTSGEGPPLVLVHGTTGDHRRWRPLLPYLEPHATVHAIDRRGCGASGDAPVYDLAREFEDVAAVVDAAAQAVQSKVDVYGHSYGGLCAFGAATLTDNIRRLVLYEGWSLPEPGGLAVPPSVLERIDAFVAQGKRDAALEAFLREVVQLSDEELAAFRAQASWSARVGNAHTITRELRATAGPEATLDPQQAASITVPTLLLTGEASPPELKAGIDAVAAALPHARIQVLEGQQHAADVLVPDVFARHVLAFLHDHHG